ncbi:hypothetical protein [Floricoccus tropicus]|nr:hypothetical protein [Floricoccus tropicus]
MNEINEIIRSAKSLGINIKLLGKENSQVIIENVIEKFSPYRLTGHVAISNDSMKLDTDSNEFIFSKYLPKGKGYIFFEQDNSKQSKYCIEIENIQLLSQILEETFGMEYFVTNDKYDYLISVNWYVIELVGPQEFLKGFNSLCKL